MEIALQDFSGRPPAPPRGCPSLLLGRSGFFHLPWFQASLQLKFSWFGSSGRFFCNLAVFPGGSWEEVSAPSTLGAAILGIGVPNFQGLVAGVSQAKLHPFWPRTHCHLYREKHQGAPRGTMAMAAAGNYSDDLHQSITQHLAKLTDKDMHWLLGDPQALDEVLQGLSLESDEASVLHYILGQELMRREEGDGPWGHLSQEERMFLLAFPWQKHKMEKAIRELRTIADGADSAHKTLTQTNLLASSAGAVSAGMTILGLALSPVTAGGSLLLSAAGQGLGAAAFVTSIVTNVLEDRSKSSARDRASRLLDRPPPGPKAGGGVSFPLVETWKASQRCCEVLGSIRQLRAYWAARANPGFMARVRNFVTTRRVPFLRATGVQRAMGQGTALAMTRIARLLGAAGAGFILAQEVKSALQDWQHLREGARAEVAEDLRTQAEELEWELSQLSRRYEQILLRQDRSLDVGGRNRTRR